MLIQWVRVGAPKGIRIPVDGVKGRCPRPLDDGGKATLEYIKEFFAWQ